MFTSQMPAREAAAHMSRIFGRRNPHETKFSSVLFRRHRATEKWMHKLRIEDCALWAIASVGANPGWYLSSHLYLMYLLRFFLRLCHKPWCANHVFVSPFVRSCVCIVCPPHVLFTTEFRIDLGRVCPVCENVKAFIFFTLLIRMSLWQSSYKLDCRRGNIW